MSEDNFETRIAEIDQEVRLQYSWNERVFAAFRKVSPDSARIIENEPFDRITHESIRDFYRVRNWYIINHPEQADLLDSWGLKPFILRNRIFHIRVQGFYESDPLREVQRLKELLIDMGQSIKDSLEQAEIDLIQEEYFKGAAFFIDLQKSKSFLDSLDPGIAEFIATGMFDINISLSSFYSPFFTDPQPVMFHTQQAVEKFLKAFLAKIDFDEIRSSGRSISDYVRKKYGHNLSDLGNSIVALTADFDTVNTKVQELHNRVPDMNIRYIRSGKTVIEAIECIDLMMEICGDISTRIA